MIDPEIKNKLDQLTPEYRAFLQSDLVAAISETFAEYHKLPPDRAVVLGNALILLLIFELNEEEFINFVTLECNLEPEESLSLYHGLILALPETIQASFKQTTATLLKAKDTVPEDLANEIMDAEASLRSIAETAKEATYTSTQAAILNEAQNLAPNNNEPRWDTAR